MFKFKNVVLLSLVLLALLLAPSSGMDLVHAEPQAFDCATVSEIPQIECEALVAAVADDLADDLERHDGLHEDVHAHGHPDVRKWGRVFDECARMGEVDQFARSSSLPV